MKARYRHTNIVSKDWEALAQFYEDVFGCVRVPPARDYTGSWLERGTGVSGAHIRGSHLRLPGVGEDGPTLEIFQYDQNLPKAEAAANREGLAHLAFEVDDVDSALALVLEHGGKTLGEVVYRDVEGIGRIIFVYATDPEGNIVELLKWE